MRRLRLYVKVSPWLALGWPKTLLSIGRRHTNISAVFALLILVSGLATACGGSTAGRDALGPGLDSGLQDVAVDDMSDVAFLCPLGAPLQVEHSLIPAPRQVFFWGEEVQVKTLSVRGSDEVEAAEVQRIAQKHGLELAEDGALRIVFHTTEEWLALRETCGFPTTDSAYYLDVTQDEKGVVASVFAADERGRFYALKTIKQLLRRAGLPTIRLAKILDYPSTSIRGVLEGFYGNPWSEEDRLQVISLAGDLKMSIFVYAPKDDWAISALWSVPFVDDYVEHVREVVQKAKEQRMQVCWEIRPTLLLEFSSAEDFEAMLAKFRVLVSNGVDCLVLAFDDMGKYFYEEDKQKYGSYIEGLVDFANRIGEALRAEKPDVVLVLVPHEYWLEAPDVETDLRWLGEHLDPMWQVAWTGNKIVSPTISGKDADAYAAIVRRKPFLGDNFPVVDNVMNKGVLNLGPLEGRSADLVERVSGVAFNASPLPYASLLGLATAADFVWNAEAYQPSRAIKAAALWLGGESGAKAILTLSATNRMPPFAKSAAPDLEKAIADFWQEFELGERAGPARTALTKMLSDFVNVPPALDEPSVLVEFARDVRPWAAELGEWGEVGLRGLDLLDAVASGETPAAGEVSWLVEHYEKLLSELPKPTGDVMPNFVGRILERIRQTD